MLTLILKRDNTEQKTRISAYDLDKLIIRAWGRTLHSKIMKRLRDQIPVTRNGVSFKLNF